MSKRRVVVTGLGLISPVGNSVAEGWKNVRDGVSGIGPIDEPLPDHARAGSGTAYLRARHAVTAAKNSPWHLRVSGDDPGVRALETTLWLWAAVLARRTARGWETADLVDRGLSYEETGRRLGVSQSAVSQRAQAAGIVEGRRARELAGALTAELLGAAVPA